MPAILQVNYTYREGEEPPAPTADLADALRDVPGLIWKTFVHDPSTRTRGAVYLFADRASAQARVAHAEAFARRQNAPETSIKVFDVYVEASRAAGAPLPASVTP